MFVRCGDPKTPIASLLLELCGWPLTGKSLCCLPGSYCNWSLLPAMMQCIQGYLSENLLFYLVPQVQQCLVVFTSLG